MDTAALETLKKALAQPEALEELAAAAGRAGAWRSWTFDRQAWFLRKTAGLTQAELARRSGVSQRRVSRIEAGDDFKLSTLRALWRALGYEPLIIPDSFGVPRTPRVRRERAMASPTGSPSTTDVMMSSAPSNPSWDGNDVVDDMGPESNPLERT